MSTTFTLISLGSRGVGKTVFLASNCAEILRDSDKKKDAENLWFECEDPEFQEKIEKLVGYVVRTGQYPPPTFKIEDFVFSLKQKSLGGNKTLCQFRWIDLPGEWCDNQSPEFQSVLLQSHGCCVFVDVHALLNDAAYLESVEAMIDQVEAISSVVNHNNLRYPLALICTKCDLIDLNAINLLKLETKLIPLIKRLESINAHYRRFYSPISILDQPHDGILNFKDANAPLLWLITELQKLHGSQVELNLGNSLNQMMSNSTQLGAKDSRLNAAAKSKFASLTKWKTLSSPQKAIFAILAACGVLSAGLALSLQLDVLKPKTVATTVPASTTPRQNIDKNEAVLRIDPSNREAITQVVDSYLELGQTDQAIARLEKITTAQPNDIDTSLKLAELYRLTGQNSKEENIYDKVLSREKNHIPALIAKASLRKEKGDLKTASILFEKAEKIAPTKNIKTMIKELSGL
jgi:tetratricopeptide (TPR) repeat protein